MFNLEDLLVQGEDSHLNLSYHSNAKQTYLPELREFEDHSACHPQVDPFFDHPDLHPHSSTFSHLESEDPQPLLSLEQPEESRAKLPGKGKQINKSRNETKNIPKNFGKGIISFVEHSRAKLTPLVRRYGLSYDGLVAELRELKRSINTIAELRALWTGEKGACLRVISNLFFRQYALEYIFNSRISSYASHIKYRSSLWQALKQPDTFNHIK
jgi:hypothetical protein